MKNAKKKSKQCILRRFVSLPTEEKEMYTELKQLFNLTQKMQVKLTGAQEK